MHDQGGRSELEEVVVGSLCIVEPVPLFIGKLVRVPSISHIGIPSLLYVVSSGGLVSVSEVRLHEIFSEDFSSNFAGESKTDEQQCESYQYSN